LVFSFEALMKPRQFIILFAGTLAIGSFAAAVLPGVSSLALAQSYPNRPINVIVPFPPGGNTDIMARALQNEMSKALSQTVVIVNKPGAAGTLGLIELARAAPDGYTIALTPNNPLTAQPHVQKLTYAMDSFHAPSIRPSPRGSMSRRAICRATPSESCSRRIRRKTPRSSNARA